MKDRRVRALRSRIQLYGDDELTRALPSRQGVVELTLKDGRELRNHVKAVRGTTHNPMKREEVDEKCFHLVAPVLGKARARRLCDTVWALDSVANVRSLRPLLTA
jgi:2-methylcitrate dehydratase PrpD